MSYLTPYVQQELKKVQPLKGLDYYTYSLKIKTEEGKTEWITIPDDKVEALMAFLTTI